jgi:hypothetical protein
MNSSVLILPQKDDICETEIEDIAAFLSGPIKSRKGMIFPISFSVLQVCLDLFPIFYFMLL